MIQGDGESSYPSLLGKYTAIKLNLFRIGVNAIHEDIIGEFKDAFTGVGKLKDYKLKLHINDSVKSVAQKACQVPFPLRDKVEKKLNELEELGIIEKVDGPTEWVNPAVVLPKSNGDIRICIDMRQAKESVIRERHLIPTVDEILQEINQSKLFSKLYIKWAFHQIELK